MARPLVLYGSGQTSETDLMDEETVKSEGPDEVVSDLLEKKERGLPIADFLLNSVK